MHVPHDLMPAVGLPLWVEVHVDDDVLADAPGAWPEAAALLEALARRAEAEGAVLCFRIRATFARGDREGFLAGLQARGHEVGWHAHGTGLREAVAALRATGVRAAAAIGAPGLVQVGRSGPGRMTRARARILLESAHALGLRVLTDRRAGREFGWQGRVPWTLGLTAGRRLTSIDVTADPFAWGVLRATGGAPTHAHGDLDWAALDALIARRTREDPLPGSYFGATVHEHNFCAAGSLKPVAPALEAFSMWLSRHGPALIRSADLAKHAVDPGVPVAEQLRTRFRRALRPRRQAPAREQLVRVDGRTVRSLWFEADSPRSVVVVVHGGAGGCTQRLGFVGLADNALGAHTLVVLDRTEGVPRAPGNPVHVADTAAILDLARAEAGRLGVPLDVLTWSGGLVAAVHAGLEGVRRLVDVEGPVDRYSLVPPGLPAHEWFRAEVYDDAVWDGREVLAGIEGFTRADGRYVRVQGEADHVHGHVDLHARVAILAAERGRAGAARLVSGAGGLGAAVLGALATD